MIKSRNVKLKNDKYEMLEAVRYYLLKTQKKNYSKTVLLGFILEQFYDKLIDKSD